MAILMVWFRSFQTVVDFAGCVGNISGVLSDCISHSANWLAQIILSDLNIVQAFSYLALLSHSRE